MKLASIKNPLKKISRLCTFKYGNSIFSLRPIMLVEFGTLRNKNRTWLYLLWNVHKPSNCLFFWTAYICPFLPHLSLTFIFLKLTYSNLNDFTSVKTCFTPSTNMTLWQLKYFSQYQPKPLPLHRRKSKDHMPQESGSMHRARLKTYIRFH